jgi:DNA-binding winged helix-turn-helix (wHTH) protein
LHVGLRQPDAGSAGSHEITLKEFLNTFESAHSWGMVTSYSMGPFHLDAETGILFRGGEPLGLGQRAVALLRALVERKGMPVSKDALIQAAWAGLTVEESNLAVQIAALRRVLDQEPGGERWIETLPRRGYRFVGPLIIRTQDGAVTSSTVSNSPAATDTHAGAPNGVPPVANIWGYPARTDPATQTDEETPAVPIRPGSPERRQLTILVCSVVGSTPLFAATDPEDVSDRIAPFHKAVTDIAARFDGFVAQYLRAHPRSLDS